MFRPCFQVYATWKKRLQRKRHELMKTIRKLRLDKETLKRKVCSLRAEVKELGEISLTSDQPKTFVTLEGNSYTSQTAIILMGLKQLGVSDRSVAGVFRLFEWLLGISFSHVPCARTVGNYHVASLPIAHSQLESILEQCITEDVPLCLQTDETTKGAAKLQCQAVSFAVGGLRSFLVLGLGQVSDKSASKSFDMLLGKVGQIGTGKGSAFIDEFMMAVKCTQSDSASTQTKFNSLIRKYRDEIMPSMIADWDKLSDGERENHREFHTFFCQLHVIANFTKVALDALAAHERDVSGKACDSPTVFSLIKEIARFLSPASAGLHPQHSQWVAWTKQHNVSGGIPSFRGHRFNILFVIAKRIFLLRASLQAFLNECTGRDFQLMKSQLADPLIVSHLRVLAILDERVTAPLWRLADTDSESILNTCEYSQTLLNWVSACENSPSQFFLSSSPSLPLSPGFDEGLFVDPASSLSLSAASLVLSASAAYFSHQFSAFLPGGKYFQSLSQDVQVSTQCAPSTNRAVEGCFGFVDHFFNYAPSMAMCRREAHLLVKKNGTIPWVQQRSEEERERIVREARKSVSAIVLREKEEEKKLHEETLVKAHDSLKRELEREENQLAKKRRVMENVSEAGGAWKSLQEMDAALSGLSEGKQRKALVAQLRLCSLQFPPPHRKFYCVTISGTPVPNHELRDRLSILFDLHYNVSSRDSTQA